MKATTVPSARAENANGQDPYKDSEVLMSRKGGRTSWFAPFFSNTAASPGPNSTNDVVT